MAEWLKNIELEEYVTLFHHEGYKWDFDIPNMKELDEEKLKSMGIRRRGKKMNSFKILPKAISPLTIPKLDLYWKGTAQED